ncbi:melanoma-associated antigen 8-like [Pteropus vampyrus]|uniref:Melanoma-associated antigen 8-like n=1 Tax=Pteropus vampyrus TaxID=132908 RepID=A0A6P3RJ52_PTEVA|nr:melanoma-associated antigen 8-like [Pteropus vampyrus]
MSGHPRKHIRSAESRVPGQSEELECTPNLTPVTTPLGPMDELPKLGEGHQDPRENPGLLEAQFFWDEDDEEEEEVDAAAVPSPPQSPEGVCLMPPAMGSSPWSQSEDEGSSSQDEGGPSSSEDSEDAESLLQDALRLKMIDLVVFLLLKYREKEPTTKAEMLSSVIKEYQDHFPEIFSLASECLQLVFGVDVKEVDPSNHCYVLDTTLGLTYDEMGNDEGSMPKTGLLITLLCLILLEGDRASEEEVWEALNGMGVRDGREHSIFGEPRELITKIWVQEEYLEYRLVPNSCPARYEFLWGPRAHAETSKMKVLEYLLRVNRKNPISFLSLFGGVDSDEEEGA